ncbi:MAG TPA: hypothetical protein DD435_16155 [Cyanobacteria bacterium UBA8530]|nr:hypothetical protein [Cyanobacteria bacterium UBA8530]
MKKRFLLAIIVASTLVLSLSTGCGKRLPTGTDEPEPTPITTPAPVVTPPPEPEPIITPVPNPMPAGTLKASMASFKKGILGFGTKEATVTVINDSSQVLSGELRVQFTDGGKADPKDVQTMQVTLQGGEQKSLTLKNTGWGIDNATVEVTTNQPIVPASTYGRY